LSRRSIGPEPGEGSTVTRWWHDAFSRIDRHQGGEARDLLEQGRRLQQLRLAPVAADHLQTDREAMAIAIDGKAIMVVAAMIREAPR
jgi:hypothetical protein